MKNFNWNYPTTMWVGENRIKDLSLACKTLNIKNPLFVTDSSLVSSEIVKETLESLNNENLNPEIYSKVFFTISELARPLSVTNRGFLIFNVLQARPMSLILFSPTHIVVG